MRFVGLFLLVQFVALIFATDLRELINGKISSSPPSSISDASFLALSMKKIGADVSQHKSVLCQYKFPENPTLNDVYNAIILQFVAECEGLVIPDNIINLLKGFYEDSVDFTPKMYFQFCQILPLFKDTFRDIIEDKEFLKRMYQEVDQSLKKYESLEDRSYLFETSLLLTKLLGGQKSIMSTTSKIQKVSAKDLYSIRMNQGLSTITKSATSIFKLASALKKDFEKERIIELSNWVREKSSEGKSYEDILNIVQFFSSVDNYLSGSFFVTSVVYHNEEKYEFVIVDIFGTPLNSEKELEVEAYFANDFDDAHLSDLALSSSSTGTFELALTEVPNDGEDLTHLLLLGQGPIIFEVKCNDPEFSSKIQFHGEPLTIKINEFSLSNFATDANVRTGTGSATGFTLKGNNEKPFAVNKGNQNFVLTFALSLETRDGRRIGDVNPRQAFLRVLTPEQDWMKLIAIQDDVMSSYGTTYKLVQNFGHDRSFKNFVSIGQVELIIGDRFLEDSKVYSIGKLDFQEFRVKYQPSDEEEKYWRLPEIQHLFHVEEKRASLIMSNVFSGLVFFPFVIFFLGVLKFLGGITIPSGIIWHLGLVGSVGGALVTIALFWIEITVFQAFFWLFVCIVVGVIFGSRALNRSYIDRIRKEGE